MMSSSLSSPWTAFLAISLSGCMILGFCVEEANGFGRRFVPLSSKHCLKEDGPPSHLKLPPIGATKKNDYRDVAKQLINKEHCHGKGGRWDGNDDGNKFQQLGDKYHVDDEIHIMTATKNASFLLLRRRLAAMFIFALSSSLLFVPPSSPLGGEEYKCPKSFTSQPLGIQNVVLPTTTNGEPQQRSLWPSPVPPTSPNRRHATSQVVCPQEGSTSQTTQSDYKEETINGIVYLPSPSNAKSDTPNALSVPLELSDNLVITISMTNTHDGKIKHQPSSASSGMLIAGAKISLSQIQAFPITFAIGRSNVILSSPIGKNGEDFASSTRLTANDNIQRKQQQQIWDESIIQNDSLQITAKICPSAVSQSDTCTESNAKLLGKGISKRLIIPIEFLKDDNGDDDKKDVVKGKKQQNEEGEQETAMIVRAAVPIRLAQSSAPDRLSTW